MYKTGANKNLKIKKLELCGNLTKQIACPLTVSSIRFSQIVSLKTKSFNKQHLAGKLTIQTNITGTKLYHFYPCL